ncbi:hypothetical protein HF673_03070 [Acidithiobacillus thiooxidans]|uniref:Uncharacterized protein n=2 Tax=Acidithiobacillus thiooxidans TaxID=930 RepID=A0A1C2J3Z3_ACITH|nr:hypothetical protein [Acidithiobacillus thiooxidans]MBU2834791.1 hypothetical protein [Acidithiobacillus thiooxidans]OCX70594.1 hypothetical protein A6M23_13735 [Acidithiobacillus thiooxidans]OCX82967.1 hypothetical protein A6P08_11370 [Acidithiobacillus thiooxidans]QFX96675.1 hypothetical protein GCD22_02485 [Acidithiobacillus thiooxidans ATCC 19377]
MSRRSDEEIDLPDDLLGDGDAVPVPHVLAMSGQKPFGQNDLEKSAQTESAQGANPLQTAGSSQVETPSVNDKAGKPSYWLRRGEKKVRPEPSDGCFSAKVIQETWIPILLAAIAILLVFASGVVFGMVLTQTAAMQPVKAMLPARAWLPVLALTERGSAAALLAPLVAPTGVILFLLAAIYAFLRSRSSGNHQSLWALMGWILLALFLAGIL